MMHARLFAVITCVIAVSNLESAELHATSDGHQSARIHNRVKSIEQRTLGEQMDEGQWTDAGTMVNDVYGQLIGLAAGGALLTTEADLQFEWNRTYHWDAAGGDWNLAGRFDQSRSGNSLNELTDGTIIAIGGFGPPTSSQITLGRVSNLSTLTTQQTLHPTHVESWSRDSLTWSQRGELPTGARWNHASVELLDGTVMVIGGQNETMCIRETAFYDTKTATAVVGPRLTTCRVGPRAVVLQDGRVLVEGGTAVVSDNGWDFEPLISAEIWDPMLNVWSEIAAPRHPRTWGAMVLLADGRALATGLSYTSDDLLIRNGTAELFDPRTDMWSEAAQPHPSFGLRTRAIVLQSDRVLVIGSAWSRAPDRDAMNSTNQIWDPKLDSWSIVPPHEDNPRSRSYPEAAILRDGRVLVAGSRADTQLYIEGPLVLTANPTTSDTPTPAPTATPTTSDTSTPTTAPATSTPRSTPTYIPTPDGPKWGRWDTTSTLPEPREGHAALLLEDGRVLIAGGIQEPTGKRRYMESTWVYDPTADTWSFAGNLPGVRYQPIALQIDDGRVVLTRGRRQLQRGSYYEHALDVWDPTTLTWRRVDMPWSTDDQIFSPTFSYMGSNKFLVTGFYRHQWKVNQSECNLASMPDSWILDIDMETAIRGPEIDNARVGAASWRTSDGTLHLTGGAAYRDEYYSNAFPPEYRCDFRQSADSSAARLPEGADTFIFDIPQLFGATHWHPTVQQRPADLLRRMWDGTPAFYGIEATESIHASLHVLDSESAMTWSKRALSIVEPASSPMSAGWGEWVSPTHLLTFARWEGVPAPENRIVLRGLDEEPTLWPETPYGSHPIGSTATRLLDGRILVVGGGEDTEVAAEIYTFGTPAPDLAPPTETTAPFMGRIYLPMMVSN